MTSKFKMALLAILVLAVAVFVWYSGWKAGQKKGANSIPASKTENTQADSASQAEEDLAQATQEFEAKCANGEWVKIADVQGDLTSVAGKLRRIYPEDEVSADLQGFEYYIESASANTALSGNDLSALENFESRDVEIQGVKSADGKSTAAVQVKCAGAETDKSAIDARTKLMDWLAANINSIAPAKAPYKSWVVDTADFVDDKNVYVEYYDAAEDDENSNVEEDTSRQALIQATPKSGGGYDVQVLAYWEMGENDYVLKSGSDKFENTEDTFLYQYDSETKSWERI